MQVSGRQEASLRLGTSLPPTRGLALSHDLVFKTLFTRQLHLFSELINTVCDRYPQWPLRNMFYLARMLSDQFSAGQKYQSLKPAVSISLLVRKFGAASADCQRCLSEASVTKLEQWTEQLFDAATQQDLFR
jgi:hypothetical protein